MSQSWRDSPGSLGTDTRKNFLYIVVDDLRGELGFTSSTRGLVSPNLDKLAARGTVFERCCESYLAGDLLIAAVRVSPLLLDKWLACSKNMHGYAQMYSRRSVPLRGIASSLVAAQILLASGTSECATSIDACAVVALAGQYGVDLSRRCPVPPAG